MKSYFILLLLLFSHVIYAGSGHHHSHDQHHSHQPRMSPPPLVYNAISVIQPINNHPIQGYFRFKQTTQGVLVQATVTGLKPNAKHGVHIHEFGDLSDLTKGTSAGPHYNPKKHPHGRPPNPIRHAGSYGNIESNKNGIANFEFLDKTITINGPKYGILGRAVVVHANEDTGEQPAGNAGPRIGVGIIGIANPSLL